jgi:four helix bundle protein
MEKPQYIKLQDLEVYQLARELSRSAWKIFEKLSWEDKKVMGFQFVESADSIGANIAEGYGRFHYLDKIKFYYNGRGSYKEFRYHWLDLLYERKKITADEFNEISSNAQDFEVKLSNFISKTYNAREHQFNDKTK